MAGEIPSDLSCEPPVRTEHLGIVGAANAGKVCLILANRQGHVNLPALDTLAPCNEICQLSPVDACE